MKLCENCQHYGMSRTDGPMCTKNNKPTSPLAVKDCWEEAPGAGDKDVQAILADVPASPAQNAWTQKKPRGRKKEHENYTDENGVLMKWCRACGKYKPADDFSRKTGAKDGLAYECRECKAELQRKGRKKKRMSELDMIRRKADEEKPVTEGREEPDAPLPEVHESDAPDAPGDDASCEHPQDVMPESAIHEPEEFVPDDVEHVEVGLPDIDAELDKVLYGDILVREGSDAFLNINGVYVPIVDWKSGSYGVKPSGLRRIAEYFFTLGMKAVR